MRLTLRTLLAYLDNVLSPTDSATLAQKVQESPKAEQLAQRIRGSLTRTDLPAMPALGNGAEDANLPAEYLDSTLHENEVAEFEQQCLASDVRLAEVADCHKILAEVLTKPVHVPPDLRERAYRLANAALSHDPAWAAHAEPSGGGDSMGISNAATIIPPSGSVDANAAVLANPLIPGGPSGNGAGHGNGAGIAPGANSAPRSKSAFKGNPPQSHDKPSMLGASPPIEYLTPSDNGGRRLTSVLVTFALLGLFIAILSQTLRPLIRLVSQEEVAVETSGQPAAVSEGDASASLDRPETSTIVPSATSVATLPATKPDEPKPTAPVPKEINAAENPSPMPTVAPSPSSPSAKPAAIDYSNLAPPPALPLDPNSVAPINPSVDSAGKGAMNPPPAEVVVAGELGSLVSEDDTLLLLKDSVTGQWLRVPKGVPLASPALLISPQVFRSRMILSGGVDMTLADATSVGVTTITSHKAPKLSVEYGRLLLGTTAADAVIPVDLHGIEGELKLTDLRSLAAFEIQMYRAMGANPEKPGASLPRVMIAAVQGELTWIPKIGEPQTIGAGQRWLFESGVDQGIAAQEAPIDWVDAPVIPQTSLDFFARAGLLERLKDAAVPADQALRDATNHRRSEVVALAAKTLLQVGGADMMFGADGILNRAVQRSYWSDHFSALQAAVSRGPDHAMSVRLAIEQMSAVESEILYRMLWGYSNEQLAAGDDERLVQWLDHPSMSVRVMAIENLKRITGGNLGYRAEVEARRPDVQKWLAKMRRGEIRWSAVPSAAAPAVGVPSSVPPAESIPAKPGSSEGGGTPGADPS